MRSFFKNIAAVVATILIALSPAPAAVAPTLDNPQTATDEPILLPFAPPLGRPIRYRTRKEVVKPSRTTAVWTISELTFSRREGGFRAHVRWIDQGVEGADAATQSAFRRFMLEFQRPYVLLLDEDGAITGLENEDAYWADMIRISQIVLRQGVNPSTSAEHEFVRSMMASFRDAPREARLALLTETVAPVVEFGAAELILGERVSTDVDSTSLFGVQVRQQIEVEPQRIEDGHVFVAVQVSIPHEEMIRAVEDFMTRIPVTGQGQNNEAERARGLAELRAGNFRRETEAEYEVALDSGLTRRHRSVERVTMGSSGNSTGQTKTILIERME